jgi:hypothetical protein
VSLFCLILAKSAGNKTGPFFRPRRNEEYKQQSSAITTAPPSLKSETQMKCDLNAGASGGPYNRSKLQFINRTSASEIILGTENRERLTIY